MKDKRLQVLGLVSAIAFCLFVIFAPKTEPSPALSGTEIVRTALAGTTYTPIPIDSLKRVPTSTTTQTATISSTPTIAASLTPQPTQTATTEVAGGESSSEGEEENTDTKRVSTPTLTATQTSTPGVITNPRYEAGLNCSGGFFNLEIVEHAKLAFIGGTGDTPTCDKRSCSFDEWVGKGSLLTETVEVDNGYIFWGFTWKALRINPQKLDWAMYVFEYTWGGGRTKLDTWSERLSCTETPRKTVWLPSRTPTATSSPTPTVTETITPDPNEASNTTES